jgi:hypothetical protein
MKATPKPLSFGELVIFKGYLYATYEYFLFNKIGHDGFKQDGIKKFSGIAGDIYYDERFKDVWDIMLRISESGYLSRLANIFDKEGYCDKNLKIYVDNIVFCRIAPESKLVGCKDTIDKIKKVRNKTLDHIDSDTHIYQGGKTLSEAFGLDPKKKDVQLLFDKTFELLGMKKNQEEIEEKIRRKFKDWYEVFEKGYLK